MVSSTQLILRRRNRKSRKQGDSARRTFWWVFFGVIFGILFILPMSGAVAGAAVMYLIATGDIPTPQDSLSALASQGVTRFFDISGEHLLYSFDDPLGDRRTWVTLESVPAYVSESLLAMEDSDFLQAEGFNPLTTASDLWRNMLIETLPADMSVTGRLVRNLLNPAADAWDENDARSREIALIAEINRRYSPRDVLEWHLNTEYFGSEAYGIEAASQIYLGKSAAELTLAEAALLTAIPNAPQYNPFEDEAAARARGLDTLRVLFSAGRISEGQFNAAAGQQIPISRRSYVQQLAPDFMNYARSQAETILNNLGYEGRQLVARGGLTITTTLDVDLYLQAECALRTQIALLNGQPAPTVTLDGSTCTSAAFLPQTAGQGTVSAPDSGSIVILDAQTGQIRALVGAAASVDAQPGVTLQPFVYLDSFVSPRRLTSPATMALDIPLSFPGAEEGLIYTPVNPDGQFYGVMNLRSAMGAALLPPATDVAYRQGMGSILNTAHQIGLNSLADNTYDVMLLERGGRVAPLDLAYAYSVFATLGDMRGVSVPPVARGFRGRDPVAVAQIQDREGNILWQYDSENAATCNTLDTCTPLLEDALAYVINDVYADSETRWQTLSQNSPLEIGRPAAIVNGPAGDNIESWTIGYTPQLVTVVNMHREDRQPMTLSPWTTEAAGTVWRGVMDYLITRDAVPAANWELSMLEHPDRIIEMPVCERSGLLPNGVCPAYMEIFRDGMQPRQTDTYWQQVNVNDRTGQLATVNTAPELVAQRVYFVPPDEAMDWWREHNLPMKPVEYDTLSVPELFTSVRLIQPEAYSYVGGEVEIYAELDTAQLQYFQLSYGQGFSPTQWIDIGGRQTEFRPGVPIGVWDTTGLEGLYSLRLVMTLDDNRFESDAVQVTVDNIAPTISLNLAEPGRVYRFPSDSEISLEAQAADNVTISRVEFFQNGQPLGADESWPYRVTVGIDRAGTQQFTAVVYDAFGNRAQVDFSVEVLRAGA